jgi:nucleoside diphosphate kinase
MPATDDVSFWTNRVLCLLGPDCLRRHLTRPVLDRFAAIGLRPAGWHLAQVSASRLDRMAELQNAGAGQVYRYRALDALFALGPALMVILADERQRPAEQLYAAVKEVKGNADPRKSVAGTIRHDLGAINVVLSLLHASDGPEQAMIESGVLAAGVTPEQFRAAGDIGRLVEIIEATQPMETRAFAEVLAGVRGRVVAQLWPALTAAGRELAAGLASTGGLAGPDAGERLAGHIDLACDGSLRTLVDVLRAPFDGARTQPDMVAVERILGLSGLALDTWELAVLTTSTYFPPAR